MLALFQMLAVFIWFLEPANC